MFKRCHFDRTVNKCLLLEVCSSFEQFSSRLNDDFSVDLDEGFVTVFDVRRRVAIHRFADDGSFSTTSMCVSPNQQYFVTG